MVGDRPTLCREKGFDWHAYDKARFDSLFDELNVFSRDLDVHLVVALSGALVFQRICANPQHGSS